MEKLGLVGKVIAGAFLASGLISCSSSDVRPNVSNFEIIRVDTEIKVHAKYVRGENFENKICFEMEDSNKRIRKYRAAFFVLGEYLGPQIKEGGKEICFDTSYSLRDLRDNSAFLVMGYVGDSALKKQSVFDTHLEDDKIVSFVEGI